MRKLAVFLLLVLVIMTSVVVAKVTLTMWCDGVETPNDIALAVQLFKKDFPDVDVKVIRYSVDAYKTKLDVAMASGELPDIFMTWGGGMLRAYVDSGRITPLSEDMVNWLKATFIPGAIDEVYYKGKYWAVPFNSIIVGDFFWYRKDIFEKHGLTPPKTWEEFVSLARKLKSLGYIPIALANKTKWPGDHFFATLAARVCGYDVAKEILDGKRSWQDPLMMKTLRKLEELIKLGAFPPGINGLDFNLGQGRILVYTGKSPMIPELNFMYTVIHDERPDLIDKIDFFPFPVVEGGKGDPRELVGIVGDWFFSISSTSPHKELAERFLRYLADTRVVQYKVEHNTFPPVIGLEARVEDPILKRVVKILGESPHVQHCWDTYLPPELAQVYLDNLQKFFDLKITPEEFVKTMDDAYERYKKRHPEFGK